MYIRLLKQDEYPRLIEIAPDDEYIRGAFLSVMESIKDNPGGISYTYAAFVDDYILGFVYGWVLPNKVLFPQYLYVDPHHRKQGIARQLLETLETKSKCTTSIAYFRESLSDFYAEQGYTIGNLIVAQKELKNDK